MTSKSLRSVSAHKQTVRPLSKSWKENLRAACLNRVRSRRLHGTPDKPQHHHDNNSISENDNGVRLMIEDEMRQQGVLLESPCAESRSQINSLIESGGCDEAMDAVVTPTPPLKAHHYVSEEELFELMEEIELEIQREEARLLHEYTEIAEQEEQCLEEQIADFEQWEESRFEESYNESFLCPVCNDANILMTPCGSFVCTNHMDGFCPLQIENTEGITMADVQQRLREAFEHHSCHCHDTLSFNIHHIPGSNGTLLIGCCSGCAMEIRIV